MADEIIDGTELMSVVAAPNSSFGNEAYSALIDGLDVERDTSDRILKISTSPDCNILNDLPVAQDAFGFRALARIVANVILSSETQTPLSIAIDGAWGTGKTSLLKMIEEQVRMLEIPCLWVNAWSFESTENLIATIAREAKAEIERSQSESRRWSYSFSAFLSKIVEAVIPQLGGASGALAKVIVKFGREVTEVASVVSARESFENLIGVLLANINYCPPRVVIFIDDLDRALPDQVVTILKNLKLVLEAKGCVFVLAMDMDAVTGSIEAHYQRNPRPPLVDDVRMTDAPSGFGRRYLEKIAQLRVEVPHLTRQEVTRYVSDLGTAPAVVELIAFAPDEEVMNPRRLKRYFNWLSITLQLISSTRLPPGVQNITALRAIALKRHHPDVYEKLISPSFDPKTDVSDLNTELREYVLRLASKEMQQFDRFLQQTPLLEAAQGGVTAVYNSSASLRSKSLTI
jgi:hypothetical protein